MKWLKRNTVRLSIVLALAAVYGCAAEMGDDSAPEVAEGAPIPRENAEITAEPAIDPAAEGVEGDESDKAGDSYVDWCNHPDANIGTLCRQQGCSGNACYSREAAAIAECRNEVRTVCGSATQAWYIVFKADGFWQRL